MQHLRRFFRRPLRRLPSVAAYALWADQYPAHAHNPLMQIEETAVLEMMPDLTGQRVLDLACGSGRYSAIAVGRGASTVISIDNAPEMLAAANIPHRACATMDALPLGDGVVETVVCGLAVGHLPQIDTALREMARILTSDGIALISDFHPYQYLTGGRRTFTASDGTVYEVEHYPHLVSDYVQMARAVGLHLIDIREPSYADKPVVLVMKFQKSGCSS